MNDLANVIDYYFLSEALCFYRDKKHYEQIQVPWSVPRLETMLTCPDESRAFKIGEDNYLVGSAEQSFLYMNRRGLLENDMKYVACTPCYRNEEIDEWHQKHFEKVELFMSVCSANPEDVLNGFIEHALECFNNSYFSAKYSYSSSATRKVAFEVEKTSIGYDINYAGIELGSYGIRKNEEHGLHWVYGTGLAEPRFSKSLYLGYNI